MSSIKKRGGGKWRARFRDAAGKEHAGTSPGGSTRNAGLTRRRPRW